MSALTSARRLCSATYWARLPAPRARSVGHLVGIAATLAAAKVVLATVGVTLFVAEEGAAGLPLFYMAFAPLAIVLSFGLGAIVDRAPRIRLAQVVFGGLLLCAVALRLLPAAGLEGTGFALLAAATVFEIVLEIVLWLVAAAYLDAFELRRATPLVYIGLALGGALGGLAAWLGAGLLQAADLVFLLVPLAALLIIQLEVVLRRLDEVPESEPEVPDPTPGLAALVQTVRLLGRFPLALLIALNALVVTLLYGLAEFLILSIYEDRFADQTELAGFLSLLFALMQMVEFALLFTLTRALLERAGPLARNLAFPATSLGVVGALLVDPKLATAVLAHLNIEALSNALFLPVNNANYVALPLGFQGRARTLSEGVFFPLGLALAGAILWGAGAGEALLGAEFAALIFALILLLVSAGVGLLFLPSLLASVRAQPAVGLAPAPAGTAQPALPRVRTLLRSRDPALCLLGLDHARRVEVDAVGDELGALAERPEPAVRGALAGLVARTPDAWCRAWLAARLTGQSFEGQKLGLLVMLIRRMPATAEQLRAVLGARDPVVVALGRLVLDGAGAELGGADEPLAASQVIEMVVSAGRPDLALPLLERVGRAEPEQLRRALVLVRGADRRSAGGAEAAARRLLRHPDGALRAEAVATLGQAGRSGRVLCPLAAALDDPHERVRSAAADALARHGDRAAALARRSLRSVTPGTVDAVRALSRLPSPRARRLLARALAAFQSDARRTDLALALVAQIDAPEHRLPLEATLLEHRRRLAEIALAASLAGVDPPLARHLRDAMASGDQRDRAKAFELLAARPAGGRPPEALRLLRYLTFEDAAGADPAPGPANPRLALLQVTSGLLGPWVRLAAAREARRAPLPCHSPAYDGRDRSLQMATSDDEFERIIVLKGMPPFRDLDLEVLRAVARIVRTRSWLRGDEVMPAGARQRALLILEAGKLSVDGAPLLAPASLGEVALAGEPISWPRIIALEDSQVGFLDGTLFDELQQNHPEVVVHLCRFLARRVRALENGARVRCTPGEVTNDRRWPT